MSVEYTCYILPPVAAASQSLSSAGLSGMIELLTNLKWATRAGSYDVRTTDANDQHLRATLTEGSVDDCERLIQAGRAFVVEFGETPEEEWWPTDPRDPDGLSRKYEFQSSGEGVLCARHCFGLRLSWAPILISVPRDSSSETPTPCPRCGSDVLTRFEGSPGMSPLEAQHFLAVPTVCSSCAGQLRSDQLVMQMRSGITGELVPEVAPFGRWVLAIDAAQPAVYPHAVESSLMNGLQDILGVACRNVGRWS